VKERAWNFHPRSKPTKLKNLKLKRDEFLFRIKKKKLRERAGKIHRETLSKYLSQNRIFFQFVWGVFVKTLFMLFSLWFVSRWQNYKGIFLTRTFPFDTGGCGNETHFHARIAISDTKGLLMWELSHCHQEQASNYLYHVQWFVKFSACMRHKTS
jgi:hypothetical protein